MPATTSPPPLAEGPSSDLCASETRRAAGVQGLTARFVPWRRNLVLLLLLPLHSSP